MKIIQIPARSSGLFYLSLLFLLAGCATNLPTPTTATTPIATIFPTPTFTPTVRPTATLVPPRIITPPESLLPTATPFMHKIAQGETLLGIALRYSIKPEEILVANPGIDPQFLTIGADLIIPTGEGNLQIAPTAAPEPVTVSPPDCVQTLTKDVWCFIQIANDLETGVESASALINLYAQDGAILATQTATTPLNLIPSGISMPLTAYFSGPLPEKFFPLATLITAFPADNPEGRYVAVDAEDPQITISNDGLNAQVTGILQAEKKNTPLGSVRILAVAYNPAGRIAGFRVWEGLPNPANGVVEYTFDIFSLNKSIGRVEVFFEARPPEPTEE